MLWSRTFAEDFPVLKYAYWKASRILRTLGHQQIILYWPLAWQSSGASLLAAASEVAEGEGQAALSPFESVLRSKSHVHVRFFTVIMEGIFLPVLAKWYDFEVLTSVLLKVLSPLSTQRKSSLDITLSLGRKRKAMLHVYRDLRQICSSLMLAGTMMLLCYIEVFLY